jgi:hypothetical protein
MALEIQASPGDWGGAPLSDIEAVARSTAASFAVLDAHESITIVLEATISEHDNPMALSAPDPSGAFVVRLNVRGNLWARLVYQFAHEYCHVLADPSTWTVDRFSWLEEALCETASLFALRDMAERWADTPPYDNWRDYSVELSRYAADHVSDPARSLPADTTFAGWFRERRPILEADSGRRADNTVIAKELLPIFESDRVAWRAVRALHAWPRPADAQLADLLDGWARACPTECLPGLVSQALLGD